MIIMENFHSWNQNGNNSNRQLRPWLDPINSGATTLDGKICEQLYFLTFQLHTHMY